MYYSYSCRANSEIGKMFEAKHLDKLLDAVEPLINENDRFKQRAGAELIAGILRGSKHWIEPERRKLWDWFISRLPVIYAQVKPDTVTFWEGLILVRSFFVLVRFVA